MEYELERERKRLEICSMCDCGIYSPIYIKMSKDARSFPICKSCLRLLISL